MSTDNDLMPKDVAEALERSAERMTDGARADLRKRVMGTIRHDTRAHYFASVSHRVAATVAAFAFLGSSVAYAANDALPGEPLYALKRGVEDTLVALLPPGALEQRMLLGIAERRAGEAADLAVGGAAAGLVDDAIQQVRAAVQEAAANGETLTEQEMQQIQRQAQDAPQQTRDAISDAVATPNEAPVGTGEQAPPTSDTPGEGGPSSGDENSSGDGTQPGGETPGNPEAPGNPGGTTDGAGSR